MKINITAIIGSNNENSFTKKLTYFLLEELVSINNNFQYEILQLNNYELQMCTGCESCFRKGICSLDKIDDFLFIKQKMQKANIVLWASPVYVSDITSIMKIFIERLACSCHLLDFAGILSYTLTTTKNTGANIVSNYLKNIQISMGFKNLGNYNFIKDENKIDSFVKNIADDFKQKYSNNFGYTDMTLENLFGKLKIFYQRVDEEINNNNLIPNDLNKFELDYWNQQWVKNSRSFQEYAVNNLKRHKKY